MAKSSLLTNEDFYLPPRPPPDTNKHLYLLTDLPADGVLDGDVDDVAAAVLAAYALLNKDVSKVTLVFCNNGTEREKQFRRCANLDGGLLSATKIMGYGDLFKLYEALGKLTELNENFKFQSEENFNNTPLPSPSNSLIIIISPITKDTVLTLEKQKEEGAQLTFQGNMPQDYNLKETIKKINEKAAAEKAAAEKDEGVYKNLIDNFGLSSLTSKKKFLMENIENNKVGTSLKKMFTGKKIGMSYALNDFVISNLHNFFKPGGTKNGVQPASELRKTYELLLKIVLFGAEVDEEAPEKGNSLKPFLETLSKFTPGEQKNIINKINNIKIDATVVGVLNSWRGQYGCNMPWCGGLEMFKFVIKFGIYVYGENFIKALFPGSKATGENSWIDVMVAQPTPVGDTQPTMEAGGDEGAGGAMNLHNTFLKYTPDMWDLYTVAHVLYPKEEVNSNDDILNKKITEKLNKGLKLLDVVAEPTDSEVKLEDRLQQILNADQESPPTPPIGGYKKTRKLKKHRTRKGHNRKRPTRKRNKSQKKRIRKTHHKRKLYKRR